MELKLTEPEEEGSPTPEAELRAIFRSIVVEHDKADGEVRIYLQGKKDGIRIAQVLLLNNMTAARGMVTTDEQWRISDDEYIIALAVAEGRRKDNEDNGDK